MGSLWLPPQNIQQGVAPIIGGQPTVASTGPRSAPTTLILGDFQPAANTSYSNLHITGCIEGGPNSNWTITDSYVDGGVVINQYGGPPYYGNSNSPPAFGNKVAYCQFGGRKGTDGILYGNANFVPPSGVLLSAYDVGRPIQGPNIPSGITVATVDLVHNTGTMSSSVAAAGTNQTIIIGATGSSSNGCGGIEIDHCRFQYIISTMLALTDDGINCLNVNMHDCYFADPLLIPLGTGDHVEIMHAYGCWSSTFNNNVFSLLNLDAATNTQVTATLNMGTRSGSDFFNNVFSNNWIYGGGSYFDIYFYGSNGGSPCQLFNNNFYSYPDPRNPGITAHPAAYPKSGHGSLTDYQKVNCYNNYADGVLWDIGTALDS